jgi:hypothetical protein
MDTKVFCFTRGFDTVKDFSFKKARATAKLGVEKWEREPADGRFQVTLDEWSCLVTYMLDGCPPEKAANHKAQGVKENGSIKSFQNPERRCCPFKQNFYQKGLLSLRIYMANLGLCVISRSTTGQGFGSRNCWS